MCFNFMILSFIDHHVSLFPVKLALFLRFTSVFTVFQVLDPVDVASEPETKGWRFEIATPTPTPTSAT
jgi:hypothetical protein